MTVSGDGPRVREAEVREAVRSAWAAVVPAAAFDETLTWQESGVDSLKSLQLLLMVEKALARPISFDLFTRETKIQDLIAILSGTRGAAHPARRRGFLIPGVFGDDPAQAELRASLRDDIALETLQLPDLPEPVAVSGDLDATAAFLAGQVMERSGGGPVILAGYSFGAHAAVATALALEARGATVELLCLFDPLPGRLPVAPGAISGWWRLGKGEALLSGVSSILVRRLVALGWVGAARRLALAASSLGGIDDVQKRRRYVLSRLRERAVRGWRPKPFRGRTILFATDDFERTGDPRPYLTMLPAAEIVRVGGRHLQMFEGQSLRTIAETLKAAVA